MIVENNIQTTVKCLECPKIKYRLAVYLLNQMQYRYAVNFGALRSKVIHVCGSRYVFGKNSDLSGFLKGDSFVTEFALHTYMSSYVST